MIPQGSFKALRALIEKKFGCFKVILAQVNNLPFSSFAETVLNEATKRWKKAVSCYESIVTKMSFKL